MEEIWKEYKYGYSVSNFGNIRNNKGILLKPVKSKSGYTYVTIKRKGLRLHRIISEVFFGESELYVNHKDGNKSNNNLDNLEYVTPSENNIHAYRVLHIKHAKGMSGKTGYKNKIGKEVAKYDLFGNIIQKYGSMRNAAMENGIQHQSVFLACKGKIQTAGGFIWKLCK